MPTFFFKEKNADFQFFCAAFITCFVLLFISYILEQPTDQLINYSLGLVLFAYYLECVFYSTPVKTAESLKEGWLKKLAT